MAIRPDPEVGYRRPGDHRLADGRVERRVFVQASPRVVWATLHDPSSSAVLFPELRFGFGNEFLDRKDGWRGLAGRYGLPQKEVRGLGAESRDLLAGTATCTQQLHRERQYIIAS